MEIPQEKSKKIEANSPFENEKDNNYNSLTDYMKDKNIKETENEIDIINKDNDINKNNISKENYKNELNSKNNTNEEEEYEEEEENKTNETIDEDVDYENLFEKTFKKRHFIEIILMI